MAILSSMTPGVIIPLIEQTKQIFAPAFRLNLLLVIVFAENVHARAGSEDRIINIRECIGRVRPARFRSHHRLPHRKTAM